MKSLSEHRRVRLTRFALGAGVVIATLAGCVPETSGPSPTTTTSSTPSTTTSTTTSTSTTTTTTTPPLPNDGTGLDWGFKLSWRNYIAGLPTSTGPGTGTTGITMLGGAGRNDDGTFHFPVASATYDATEHATNVSFVGGVEFLSHCDGPTVARPCALDVTMGDLRVEIDEAGSVLHGRLATQGADLSASPEIAIAVLATEGITPTTTAGRTTWSTLPASLTTEAAEVYTYPPYQQVDPATFTYVGDGGAPPTESWAAPGTALMTHSVPDGVSNLLSRVVKVDTASWLGLIGSPVGFVDPSSLALTSTTVNAIADIHTLGFDPITSSVFGASQTAATVYTSTYVNGGWTARKTMSLVPSGARISAAAWDPLGQRYLVNVHQFPSFTGSQLWEVKQVAGVWTPSVIGPFVDTAGAPWTSVANQIIVSHPDANGQRHLLVASGLGTIDELVIANGVATVTPFTANPMLGTTIYPVDGGYYAATPTTVRFYRETNGVIDPTPVVAQVPSIVGQYGYQTKQFYAVEATNTLYFVAANATQIVKLVDGVEETRFSLPEIPVLTTADTIVGFDGTGRLLINKGRTTIHAYTYVGSTPRPTTQPVDTIVALPQSGTTAATFTAAATGDPAPTVQWQTRLPGVDGWHDLAEGTEASGVTTTTLTVQVGAADASRQYRAIFTNSIGAVPSSVAKVTFSAAPSIVNQTGDVTAAAGSDVQLQIMPAGSPYPTITWQQADGSNWVDVVESATTVIDGGFLNLLDVTVAQSDSRFRAVIANSAGSITSTPVFLTVTP